MIAPTILTSNQVMQQTILVAERAASSTTSILITGESGTGKNLLAEHIHYSGERSQKPFMEVQCANLPAELIESELFGYEKGAFTGAIAPKKGRFELADGGTALIDEIAELPYELQAKLLRFLQDKTFEKLGGSKTIRVDVRIVATTNADLPALIEKELFREDLYYRINVLNLHIPPLRERKEDILILSSYFLKLFCEKNSTPGLKLSEDARRTLELYHWPGNVRELRNVIENAAILCDGNRIRAKDLHLDLAVSSRDSLARFAESRLSIDEIEKLYIEEIMKVTGGNRSKAAKILGINRKTLLEKRKKYGLID